MYDAIENNLPTKNIPHIIETFARRTVLHLERVPHRTTCEMMTRELGIMSDSQLAEMLMKYEKLNIGFDITTQEGIHIHFVCSRLPTYLGNQYI